MRCFRPYWAPTSYQISEKSLERFLRYAVMDGRTDGRTHPRDWFYRPCGFQPGTKKNLSLERQWPPYYFFFRINWIKKKFDVRFFEKLTSEGKISQNWPKTCKNGQNWRFTGEKLGLFNRYNFLAHFGKIKKKSSERFFRKVSKTPKWRQICLWRQYFKHKWAVFV